MKAAGKIQISKLASSFLSFGIFIYFTFHLLHGDRGYFALKGINARIEQAQADYDLIHDQRMKLENRVKLLRPGSLDLDMLDERARAVLGYTKPDEKIIIEPSSEN